MRANYANAGSEMCDNKQKRFFHIKLLSESF